MNDKGELNQYVQKKFRQVGNFIDSKRNKKVIDHCPRRMCQRKTTHVIEGESFYKLKCTKNHVFTFHPPCFGKWNHRYTKKQQNRQRPCFEDKCNGEIKFWKLIDPRSSRGRDVKEEIYNQKRNSPKRQYREPEPVSSEEDTDDSGDENSDSESDDSSSEESESEEDLMIRKRLERVEELRRMLKEAKAKKEAPPPTSQNQSNSNRRRDQQQNNNNQQNRRNSNEDDFDSYRNMKRKERERENSNNNNNNNQRGGGGGPSLLNYYRGDDNNNNRNDRNERNYNRNDRFSNNDRRNNNNNNNNGRPYNDDNQYERYRRTKPVKKREEEDEDDVEEKSYFGNSNNSNSRRGRGRNRSRGRERGRGRNNNNNRNRSRGRGRGGSRGRGRGGRDGGRGRGSGWNNNNNNNNNNRGYNYQNNDRWSNDNDNNKVVSDNNNWRKKENGNYKEDYGSVKEYQKNNSKSKKQESPKKDPWGGKGSWGTGKRNEKSGFSGINITFDQRKKKKKKKKKKNNNQNNQKKKKMVYIEQPLQINKGIAATNINIKKKKKNKKNNNNNNILSFNSISTTIKKEINEKKDEGPIRKEIQGSISSFNNTTGTGFVKTSDQKNISKYFFNFESVKRYWELDIKIGDKVKFDVVNKEFKQGLINSVRKEAVNIYLIEKDSQMQFYPVDDEDIMELEMSGHLETQIFNQNQKNKKKNKNKNKSKNSNNNNEFKSYKDSNKLTYLQKQQKEDEQEFSKRKELEILVNLANKLFWKKGIKNLQKCLEMYEKIVQIMPENDQRKGNALCRIVELNEKIFRETKQLPSTLQNQNNNNNNNIQDSSEIQNFYSSYGNLNENKNKKKKEEEEEEIRINNENKDEEEEEDLSDSDSLFGGDDDDEEDEEEDEDNNNLIKDLENEILEKKKKNNKNLNINKNIKIKKIIPKKVRLEDVKKGKKKYKDFLNYQSYIDPKKWYTGMIQQIKSNGYSGTLRIYDDCNENFFDTLEFESFKFGFSPLQTVRAKLIWDTKIGKMLVSELDSSVLAETKVDDYFSGLNF